MWRRRRQTGFLRVNRSLRYRYIKGGTSVWFALYADVSAVGFHQAFCVAQPQSQSRNVLAAHCRAAVEFLEDVFQFVGWDAPSVVAHFDVCPVARLAEGDCNDGFAPRILHGVFQQVAEDVADVHPVGFHEDVLRLGVDADAHALPFGLFRQRTEEGVQAEHGAVERNFLEVAVGHVAQLREIGGEVVQLCLRIGNRFPAQCFIAAHFFVLKYRHQDF